MYGMQNFHYAISLAQTLYDIDFTDIEQAEEIGLVAYNHIGNHHTHLYRVTETVDSSTGIVELPCNLLRIESVTEPCFEDWESSSAIHEYGNAASASIEGYIESHKSKRDPLYESGRFVKYRQEGNQLYVPRTVSKVTILYHGEILDEEGLPYLNDKEALAIAEYLGYITKYKEAIRTNNKAALQMANDLKQQWLFHCDAARVPVYISQNDMDMVLDAQTSWNRKKYHFSFKPTL
jgi:hypothetical protein